MPSITLSSSVRDNLLALQNTAGLVKRTQGRLATGLSVRGPIDDPVNYFQSKGLSDRAGDFTEKKQGIDQGISTLTAALDAASGIEKLVQQLKGLAINAKSATSSQMSDIVTQFSDLRNQINYLATDATYQGLNLVAGSGETLRVEFSRASSSLLNTNSVDLTDRANGLAVRSLVNATSGLDVNYGFNSATNMSSGSIITVTVSESSSITLTSGTSVTFSYGGATVTLSVGSSGNGSVDVSTPTLTSGQVLTLTLSSGAVDSSTSSGKVQLNGVSAGTSVSMGSYGVTGQYTVGIGNTFTTTLNDLIGTMDTALGTLRSKSQVLGSNVALLQTRLDFTTNYVNTLTGGSGKLTLADLNEEGANLLALQTRQQLGIQALSFAGQAEQSILGLFR
jgi:flagellin-like hook-associated protein FlgL